MVASSRDWALSMMEPATAMLTVGFSLSGFSSHSPPSFLCFCFFFSWGVPSSAVAAPQSSSMASLRFFLFCFLSLCHAFPAAAASLLAGFMAADKEEYG